MIIFIKTFNKYEKITSVYELLHYSLCPIWHLQEHFLAFSFFFCRFTSTKWLIPVLQPTEASYIFNKAHVSSRISIKLIGHKHYVKNSSMNWYHIGSLKLYMRLVRIFWPHFWKTICQLWNIAQIKKNSYDWFQWDCEMASILYIL